MQIKALTLNLHGYHPTNELPRWFENRAGEITAAPTNIFFFTPDELARGHRRRLDALANALKTHLPDIVLLQEVAAGWPNRPRMCRIFQQNPQADAKWKNSAWRLLDRLRKYGYTGQVACRGNIGWITDEKTFQNRRVLSGPENGSHQIVFDFGANPYPQGILVEGFALLARQPWRVLDHQTWRLAYNNFGDKITLQVAALQWRGERKKTRPLLIVANLHGGHKLAHFEQAVAIRMALSRYRQKWTRLNKSVASLIGGDLNAQLYRGVDGAISDAATIPWEIRREGVFDFCRPDSAGHLQAALHALNRHETYKPWAMIQEPAQASQRIEAAVTNFFAWQQRELETGISDLTLQAAVPEQCVRFQLVENDATVSGWREQIDHLFASPELLLQDARLLFTEHTWKRTDTLSDHPALLASYLWAS